MLEEACHSIICPFFAMWANNLEDSIQCHILEAFCSYGSGLQRLSGVGFLGTAMMVFQEGEDGCSLKLLTKDRIENNNNCIRS